ncbi:MAG: hypothetical protein OEU48_10910, partial [Gammaproteobacteria bacterium]|nr:hypothetical protein [Gammaproteobacteria bacterium]
MSSQHSGNISKLRWQTGTATSAAPGRRKHGWKLLLLLAITAFVLTGIWIHNRVEDALHQIISENLQTILAADIAALEFWMAQER